MNPHVDQDLCIGCGLCSDLAPSVFELGNDGFSHVIGSVGPGDDYAVQEAADSCPTCAIALE